MQGLNRLLPLWGVMLMLAFAVSFSAAPAFAMLPRTYEVTRIDSPAPQSGDRFGDSVINAGGDIDGDGPDDMLVGIGRGGAVKGKLLLLNGVDGSVIREIPAPSDDVDGDSTELESAPGDPDAPTGFGAAISSIADMGSCRTGAGDPGGEPGSNCDTTLVPQTDQDTGDGVPEILVSAVGLDIGSESDDQGAVFVIDGDTGAILKRIRTPDAEASADVGFGRSVLSPGGESACAGTGRGGISPCSYAGSPAVQQGDVNDQGKPDIVIGAPDYDDSSTTNPTACSDGAGGGTCSRAGRVYVFYGESLVGVPPDVYPASASVTIKSPVAQHDGPEAETLYWSEEMGVSLAPVGDIGRCLQSGAAGSACPDELRSPTPDGQPEYVVSAPGVDAGGIPDAGLAFVIDGATGTALDTYRHPEPQAEALFGFSSYNLPALGDVGGFDILPDVYLPAIGQSVESLGQGRGYVFSGRNAGTHLISTLVDPTPAEFGNFGTSSVGIGNVAGAEAGLDSRKEILIGAFGSQQSNLGVGTGVNDVHIFSPLTGQALQTIPDPDQQPGSGFGRGLAPMGDVNADGFLDFAVGAGGFDSSSPLLNNRGRIYLFTSDNSPQPPAPPAPPQQTPPQQTPRRTTPTVVQTLAGRTIEIESNRRRISSGAQVTLRGVVEAFSNEVRCERGQNVQVQRRRRGSILYRTFSTVKTNTRGTFTLKTRPRATFFYRARLSQSAFCLGAVSPREQVSVRNRTRKARR